MKYCQKQPLSKTTVITSVFMSLDVSLYRKLYLSYDEGKTYVEKEECVYDANITHNLGEMADKAGIYYALWRPEEIEKSKAKDIIELLEKGLTNLKASQNILNNLILQMDGECRSILSHL